jgi:hypothetical protein
VLVGHNQNGVADPYGAFSVIVRDANNQPFNGWTVTVDFSSCCPDIRLSDEQHGTGVSHVAGSAKASAVTDEHGTARFVIEGAASQGAGPSTGHAGAEGCALIWTNAPLGISILLTNGIDHPDVLVSTPDENGAAGSPGVGISDLSVFISDKNACTISTANFRQRSDFDFHLPVFNCSAVFSPASGFGVNVGDLSQWVGVKNSHASDFNGPFPANCP